MLEYKIIVPQADNNGQSLAALHLEIAAKLARVFKGYTASDARGGWIDASGATITEAVTVYTVACDSGWFQRENNITIEAWLKAYAQGLCYEARQDCIYISKGTLASLVRPK